MVETWRKVRRWMQHEAPSDTPFFLIVGLGNPGDEYRKHRHNIGFQCLDHLAQLYRIKVSKKRFKALLGDGSIGAQRVVLAKPLTFMNESGRAIAPLSRWYKVPPERIVVIHDDLDLPLGKIRVRPNGSSGGHRGINSLIAELGTRDFVRLRIGIGRPTVGDPVDYVLNDFGRDQAPVIQAVYEHVVDVVRCLLENGVQEAMNTYNAD